MGIDYDGVGGIGIEIDEDVHLKLIENGVFTDDEWDEDRDGCLEELDILYQQAGNAYSGDVTFYLFVEGENLIEINRNAPKFIDKLNAVGINITIDKLKVISETFVY